MKITIKQNEWKINLYFPMFFIKYGAFNKLINKNEEIQFSFKEYYPILRKYVKKNGHFDLVEIESNDSKITIRI